ncbi:hypothetical protein EYF80_022083 [Liparis tanakae]|uniref:Uncharacterized protein n=1 Tax=Liparis tanakae TaxID=230148 RepID=A0A4Z2HPM8_9TELE|nr:hypothetical protein EYF80_022083 [Liparis tanakae]
MLKKLQWTLTAGPPLSARSPFSRSLIIPVENSMVGSGFPVAMQTHWTPSRTTVHFDSSRSTGASVEKRSQSKDRKKRTEKHSHSTVMLKELLALPCSFSARQRYCPSAWGVISASCSTDSSSAVMVPTSSPSFSQVSVGAGLPRVLQCRASEDPSCTVMESLTTGSRGGERETLDAVSHSSSWSPNIQEILEDGLLSTSQCSITELPSITSEDTFTHTERGASPSSLVRPLKLSCTTSVRDLKTTGGKSCGYGWPKYQMP